MSRLHEATEQSAAFGGDENSNTAKASTSLRALLHEFFASALNLSLLKPTWTVHRAEADAFVDAVLLVLLLKHSGRDEP